MAHNHRPVVGFSVCARATLRDGAFPTSCDWALVIFLTSPKVSPGSPGVGTSLGPTRHQSCTVCCTAPRQELLLYLESWARVQVYEPQKELPPISGEGVQGTNP